eukprot:6200030-Pleurochrysis_carterae.AAC.1
MAISPKENARYRYISRSASKDLYIDVLMHVRTCMLAYGIEMTCNKLALTVKRPAHKTAITIHQSPTVIRETEPYINRRALISGVADELPVAT